MRFIFQDVNPLDSISTAEITEEAFVPAQNEDLEEHLQQRILQLEAQLEEKEKRIRELEGQLKVATRSSSSQVNHSPQTMTTTIC